MFIDVSTVSYNDLLIYFMIAESLIIFLVIITLAIFFFYLLNTHGKNKLKNEYSKIIQVLVKRYIGLIDARIRKGNLKEPDEASLQHVKKICYKIINDDDLPMMEKSRHIGYIQKSLEIMKLLNASDENEYVNHLVQAIYSNIELNR